MSNIGNYLKKLREAKNLTLLQLQEASGVSNSHISRIERGLREPSPEILKKLSGPLGVPYELLLEKAGYIDNMFVKEEGVIYNANNPADKIVKMLSDDPELFSFWDKLKDREDLQLLFKQTKDMSPRAIRQVIQIIKIIESEEHERYNS